MFIQAIKNNIEQNIALLNQINDEVLTTHYKVLGQSTIGQHLRHIIEFYNCLLDGYTSKTINYDNRKRELAIENNTIIAIQKLKHIVLNLDKPDSTLNLMQPCVLGEQIITTTYYRELLHNLEHSIHHQAIIKIALLNNTSIILPSHFGVAPSTIEHQTKCAL